MKPGVAAREAACRIVSRVLRSGAYSNVVVRSETAGLERRAAQLSQRLAYDTLRHLLRIDRTIAAYSSRAIDEIDPDIHDALRVGVTEILFEATADHAAVDTVVDVVRARLPHAAGFANAVLRQVARSGEPSLPGGPEGEALRFGQPLWLYQNVVAAWGEEEAAAFFAASQQEADRSVRLRHGEAPSGAVAVPGIAGSFVHPPPGPVDANTVVQDPASVAVGNAVGAQPGERVLDMAAAPGGKTLHLFDQMGARGLLVAADHHHRRARQARRRLDRLGAVARWCVADGRRVPFRAAEFDRVLLDAPCTGLGTLRRRPEVRYRVTPGSVSTLAGLQRQMLEEALRVVRPGGVVVYSVCTITSEETTEVIDGLGAEAPADLPGRRWGEGLLLAPHLTGTDGMYITRIPR